MEEAEASCSNDEDCGSQATLMYRIDNIAEVLEQTSHNLALFERLLPAASRKGTGILTPASGCQCEELRSKLSQLEAKYSQLELKYVEKEQERESLVLKLDKVTDRTHLTDSQPVVFDGAAAVDHQPAKESQQSPLPCRTAGNESETIDLQVPQEFRSSQVADLRAALRKLSTLEESRSRLKDRTKSLLRQYREKRALLERRERQLLGQRAGLQQLQLLLRSQNSCQLLVLRHTASHLEELARLLAALLPDSDHPQPIVEPCSRDNLMAWCAQLESLAQWTRARLLNSYLGGQLSPLQKEAEPGGLEAAKANLSPNLQSSGLQPHQYSLLAKSVDSQEKILQVMLSEIDVM